MVSRLQYEQNGEHLTLKAWRLFWKRLKVLTSSFLEGSCHNQWQKSNYPAKARPQPLCCRTAADICNNHAVKISACLNSPIQRVTMANCSLQTTFLKACVSIEAAIVSILIKIAKFFTWKRLISSVSLGNQKWEIALPKTQGLTLHTLSKSHCIHCRLRKHFHGRMKSFCFFGTFWHKTFKVVLLEWKTCK